MKKMIVFAAGGLALVGASIGATVFLVGGNDPANSTGVETPAAALPAETFYYPMQPEFTVNLPPGSRERFLMVELAVATNEKRHIELLEQHSPEIRNELLMLFGSSDSEALAGEEGKQQLRDEARARIDTLLAGHGESEPVKDVFLTRFVMQ